MVEILEKSCSLFPQMGTRHDATLQAALYLFNSKGYFNTSIHEIVARAGVSVGFVYHHFTDKVGVAKALFDHLLLGMNQLLDEIEIQHVTAQDRCKAVVKMLFDLTESEPDAMGFIIHARHKEFLPSEKSICSTSAFIRMRRFVAEGIEQKELIALDPVIASSLVYGAAIRLVCLRLDGLVEQPLHHHLDQLWVQVWSSVSSRL